MAYGPEGARGRIEILAAVFSTAVQRRQLDYYVTKLCGLFDEIR